jgi:hypothetical protein
MLEDFELSLRVKMPSTQKGDLIFRVSERKSSLSEVISELSYHLSEKLPLIVMAKCLTREQAIF